MKLELKHLAPYLPYKLKLHNLTVGKTLKMIGCEFTHELRIRLTDGLYAYDVCKIKPILRPLSDLTKISDELLINEYTINILLHEKYNQQYGIFSHYKGQLDIELDGEPDLRYDSNKSISFFTILTIQEQLLKGHYDIFGLIEKGLAIDINKL